MAQYLDAADKFFYPRKERFPERYLDNISALVNAVTTEIVNKQERNFRNARLLNASLAFLLNDTVSLMDRGFVLMLLRNYIKEMNLRGAHDPNLSFLKLELLHILCTHEHYVVLNLPFPSAPDRSQTPSPTPSINSLVSSGSSFSLSIVKESMTTGELSLEFREQHYLVGLLLCELKNAFDSNEQDLMKEAVDVIKDLISSHDGDSRYDSTVCRSRIAALYMPLLAITMDILPQLYGFESEKDSVISEAVAMAIAMSSVPSKQVSIPRDDSRVDLQSQLSKSVILNMDSTRTLLIYILWVLKNIDQKTLMQWWGKLRANRVGTFLEVLDLCVKLFEYHGKKLPTKASIQNKKSKPSEAKLRLQTLEEAILSKGAARDMLSRHKGTIMAGEAEINIKIEGSLAAESSFIILDTLELLVKTITENDSLRVVINTVLRVLLHSLACNQSTSVLQSMFATERSIVKKFPELLFEEDTELCGDLCFRLLNHCSSALSTVRAQAAASLYLLMRQNYEIGSNFSRVKLQVTISLSTLVGSSQTFSEDHLRRALKTIITYAQTDQQLKSTPFPEQDSEMLIDLMYRIAKGYQNSPDLRLTWLQNMAGKHTEGANHAEAAICLVHSAALVAEYLSMVEDKRYLPVGCVDFQKISYNALEESAVSDDVVSPDEEGICSGKYFTEAGLIGLLEQAAYSFSIGQMYELVNEVYKLLIPIHEAKRDHKKLGSIHSKLSDAFKRIVEREGKRMMGTYFGVGFYGSRFGDIDGEEFIYKEPAITKLPEISHRLQGFFGEKFGHDVVEVIKDSNVVDPNRLDTNKIVLSPIELAIEDIQSKTSELIQAIMTDPPDAKMLQMVLQGCVGTTVNQGPMEIANVFLSDFEKEKNEETPITRSHHKLRLCFKEFVKRCGEALAKNETLITIDQRAYQKELERNYKSFVEKLEPLLKSRFGTLRGSLRKKDGSPLYRQMSDAYKDGTQEKR